MLSPILRGGSKAASQLNSYGTGGPAVLPKGEKPIVMEDK
jgi:hypothetical protein